MLKSSRWSQSLSHPKSNCRAALQNTVSFRRLRDGAVCGEGPKTICAVQGKIPNLPAEILMSKRHQLRRTLREGKEEVGFQDTDFFGDLPLESPVSMRIRVKLLTLDIHSYKL